MKARDNPFATHRLDALAYRPQGESWESALRRLQALGWRGAVVGQEGSGKTALMQDLAPRLRSRGFEVESLDLGHGQRTLPRDTLLRLGSILDARHAFLLDGAEQLGPAGWRAVRGASRRAGAFVISLHRPGRLETWVRCATTPELLEELAAELLGRRPDALAGICREAFEREGGNLRRALLYLYDTWHEGRLGG